MLFEHKDFSLQPGSGFKSVIVFAEGIWGMQKLQTF